MQFHKNIDTINDIQPLGPRQQKLFENWNDENFLQMASLESQEDLAANHGEMPFIPSLVNQYTFSQQNLQNEKSSNNFSSSTMQGSQRHLVSKIGSANTGEV